MTAVPRSKLRFWSPSLRQVKRIIKPLVFVGSLIPFVWLLLEAFSLAGSGLGANPIEAIQDWLGLWALRFLLITLSISPLHQLTGIVWLLQLRRMLGLFTFFYASLHALNYLVLDKTFDFLAIIEDIIERQFITLGAASILLMIPLAVTSTKGWRRRLGKRWQKLHYLIYPIAIMVCCHFFWQVKQDILEPLVYCLILSTLLGYRFWRIYQQKYVTRDASA